MALAVKGEMREACRVCDIAFLHFHSNRIAMLLIKVGVLCNGTCFRSAFWLPQAVVLFVVGEHEDAISRIDDLLSAVDFNSTLYVVQACG